MVQNISTAIPNYHQNSTIIKTIDDKKNLISNPQKYMPYFKDLKQDASFIKAPVPTLLAYLQNINTNQDFITVKFNVPITNLENMYSKTAVEKIQDLKSRAGVKGQVLNWIEVLPKEQIGRLDEIYELADFMKQNGGEKLGIIGIGGSKHTVENMLSLNNKDENIVFLSTVNPDDIEKFFKKLGDVRKANLMIASKSGTTIEPSKGYEVVEKLFENQFKMYYMKDGLSEPEALKKAKEEVPKHIVCITDKNSQKSKLRQIANEKGYKCGIIHDDCGGRFGAFDDHALTALAWAGLNKEDMKKMLEASLKAQKKFLNEDISKNSAMKRAIFNADCVLNGKINQHDYYFGDAFKGTTLWNTQLKKESHKSLYKVSADLLGPEFLHNSTESDLDSGNDSSFYTFNRIKNNNQENYKTINALFDGSYKAYSKQHPTSIIELKDNSPEAIGEFIELKHFETMYTGMLLRALNPENQASDITDSVLPEVTQPNVGIYKKEVNQILSNN